MNGNTPHHGLMGIRYHRTGYTTTDENITLTYIKTLHNETIYGQGLPAADRNCKGTLS